jgi:5-methylcytosine-specific restriction endonuclease McrA
VTARAVPCVLLCRQCGIEFAASRRDAMYCTKVCATRAFHLRRMADGRQAAMNATSRRNPEFGTSCTDCAKPLRRSRLAEPRCRPCHQVRAAAAEKRARRRRRAAERLAAATVGTCGRFPFVSGCCLRCGEWFTYWQVGQPLRWRYCSKKCRGGKKTNRNRKISPVRRLAVYERDGWVCQICGDGVDREAVGTCAPGAPTIDHRIPLAADGAHDESNWQTAHR